MKIKKQSTSPTRKIILICALIIAAALLSYGAFAKISGSWPFNGATPEDTPVRPVNSVDYGPPSEQEVDNSQNAKENLVKEKEANETDTTETNKKKSASVAISFADIYNDNLEIRAFTPSVIEGTGECTVTVSRSGYDTIVKSSDAFVDASSSICKPIYIPKSQLANGAWSVNVTYVSPTHTGTSGPMTVEVK